MMNDAIEVSLSATAEYLLSEWCVCVCWGGDNKDMEGLLSVVYLQCTELVDQAAKRPDVRFACVGKIVADFRREVVGCSDR